MSVAVFDNCCKCNFTQGTTTIYAECWASRVTGFQTSGPPFYNTVIGTFCCCGASPVQTIVTCNWDSQKNAWFTTISSTTPCSIPAAGCTLSNTEITYSDGSTCSFDITLSNSVSEATFYDPPTFPVDCPTMISLIEGSGGTIPGSYVFQWNSTGLNTGHWSVTGPGASFPVPYTSCAGGGAVAFNGFTSQYSGSAFGFSPVTQESAYGCAGNWDPCGPVDPCPQGTSTGSCGSNLFACDCIADFAYQIQACGMVTGYVTTCENSVTFAQDGTCTYTGSGPYTIPEPCLFFPVPGVQTGINLYNFNGATC